MAPIPQAPIFWACAASLWLAFTQVLPTCTMTLNPEGATSTHLSASFMRSSSVSI